MSAATLSDRSIHSPGPVPGPAAEDRLGAMDVLALSTCCGLVAGWLEVGSRVLCRSIDPTNRLYLMTRHFVWLVPLSNLLLFSGMGLLLAVATKLWPRRGGWIGARILCAGTVLPALVVAGPRIHKAAWMILALGIASCLAPRLERPVPRLRRCLKLGFPGLLASILVVAALVFGGERLAQWRESSRPLPPADSPNVLLIVLDTVRADHLSLYGYGRATSRTLERLARRGVRFDEAHATAPWTLPSHASLFTGRWPYEMDIRWLTPLRTDFPTLAQYLGSRGYATAGFVANTRYCSYDTGLDRGFTHYEDYALDLEALRPLRTAWLFDAPWDWCSKLALVLSRNVDLGRYRPRAEDALRWLLATGRKDAASINHAFLDWLSTRREPRRPFFAFLNYFDVHSPYLPPQGSPFRFGSRPRSEADFLLLGELWTMIDKLGLSPRHRSLAQASYDNCIAYLDDRLGELFDELQRRGVLDRTLVIITSDHGEELGEHGLFDHGESLYRPEIRVPLLIAMPGPGRRTGVVRQVVSLRDLPGTVADLVGLADGSPFPGRSLASLVRGPSPGADRGPGDGEVAVAELPEPNPTRPNRGRSPASRGRLISLSEGDYVYICNEADGREQLFNEREDPDELSDRAGVEAMQPVLRRFRQQLDRIKAGPAPAAR